MGMTDPVADLLTRIRNAARVGHKDLEIPASRIKLGISDALKREGYIKDFKFLPGTPQGTIKISLKSVPVIEGIQRVSKPGRRVYVEKDKIPVVKDGIGIAILSTSHGILSSREAKLANTGGEIIAYLW
jgi:small subunit ribosomal protein S8